MRQQTICHKTFASCIGQLCTFTVLVNFLTVHRIQNLKLKFDLVTPCHFWENTYLFNFSIRLQTFFHFTYNMNEIIYVTNIINLACASCKYWNFALTYKFCELTLFNFNVLFGSRCIDTCSLLRNSEIWDTNIKQYSCRLCKNSFSMYFIINWN